MTEERLKARPHPWRPGTSGYLTGRKPLGPVKWRMSVPPMAKPVLAFVRAWVLISIQPSKRVSLSGLLRCTRRVIASRTSPPLLPGACQAFRRSLMRTARHDQRRSGADWHLGGATHKEVVSAKSCA